MLGGLSNLAQQTVESVVIYTHPDCPYSTAQKEDFRRDGVQFQEIDVAIHPEAVTELESFTGGEHITPVVVEGEKVTIGYHGVG